SIDGERNFSFLISSNAKANIALADVSSYDFGSSRSVVHNPCFVWSLRSDAVIDFVMSIAIAYAGERFGRSGKSSAHVIITHPLPRAQGPSLSNVPEFSTA